MECWVGSYSFCETNIRILYGSSCANSFVLCCNTARRSLALKEKSLARYDTRIYQKKIPQNLRYLRYPKQTPDPCLLGLNTVARKKSNSYARDTNDENDDVNSFVGDELGQDEIKKAKEDKQDDDDDSGEEGSHNHDYENGEIVWESNEIEAISSLFKGRIPQKPGKLNRERPLPLPFPYKNSPLGLPTQKKFSRKPAASSTITRQSVSNQLYKNPTFLIGLAKDVKGLSPEENDVAVVLNKWAPFLRKGSLSITIRELGHMGLPERALQVFCWIQKQPHLFPDDRVLASTVEVLARSNQLKMLFKWDDDKFTSLASRSVYEAMAKGFIKGGNLRVAWKLLTAAKEGKRVLDAAVYAKLILELGKNPDKEFFVSSLLEELAEREDLNLTLQDCTAIMKICIRFKKFTIVEGLFEWFEKSGRVPSIVMYTTLVHSRYAEEKYREALAVVWEMEASNCLFDLPAYRVVFKLFVALNDLPRAVRYFSKLKEAGFSPTFDVYKDMIQIYMATGRISKCKEVLREAEMAGFNMDCLTLTNEAA
ncbi:hypothetical protein M9H77_07910 [Catharanthus roseus]|uniref:Uncharacterized protein n=1 Tax=Catharanthus roseus TaxID=4058 RepID=A0ACC0BWB4_CATRO|nr:hypothetical protein M9H77_07910 [Catharanthus roseus]